MAHVPRNTRSKRTPSTEDSTRQRIVAEARRHFLAHGFRSVSMDDLAAELGMSKKTLYAHFPAKEALLEAAIADKFRSVDAAMERVTAAREVNFFSTLQELITCAQTEINEIQPPFIRDLHREGPHVFKMVEDRRRELILRHFRSLFQAGRRAGIIRKDIPTSVMIEILLGAIQAVVNPAKLAELRLQLKPAFSTVITVILEGVITGKKKTDYARKP